MEILVWNQLQLSHYWAHDECEELRKNENYSSNTYIYIYISIQLIRIKCKSYPYIRDLSTNESLGKRKNSTKNDENGGNESMKINKIEALGF